MKTAAEANCREIVRLRRCVRSALYPTLERLDRQVLYLRRQWAKRWYIQDHAGSRKLRRFPRRVVRAVLQGGGQ